MKFYDSKGNIAIIDKENANLAAEHFNKVFNRDTKVDQKYIHNKNHKPRVNKLVEPISWEEFNCAINKLTQHKVLGINGILPNLLKVLDDCNRQVLFEFMRDWIEDNSIMYEKQKKSHLVPLPKKDNIYNLNNWR